MLCSFDVQVTEEGGGFTSTYIGYMVPGGILLAILAVGVHAFCFYTIWRHRWTLDEPQTGKAYGFLYGSYSRRMPYCSLLISRRVPSVAGASSTNRPRPITSSQGKLSK